MKLPLMHTEQEARHFDALQVIFSQRRMLGWHTIEKDAWVYLVKVGRLRRALSLAIPVAIAIGAML